MTRLAFIAALGVVAGSGGRPQTATLRVKDEVGFAVALKNPVVVAHDPYH